MRRDIGAFLCSTCDESTTAGIRIIPRSQSQSVLSQGGVYRVLSKEALSDWDALSATQFFPRLSEAGKFIRTEKLDSFNSPEVQPQGHWAGVLKHQRIPFISYPYEWSFGMLKDAALLQLESLLVALNEDLILKDSSAFNVQWKGGVPAFIDITSFEKLVPGEPWVGYRQFCQLFLYPLLLQAYKDVPFQPWLRGSLDGIDSEHCEHLMSARDFLRPGILHTFLCKHECNPGSETLSEMSRQICGKPVLANSSSCPTWSGFKN